MRGADLIPTQHNSNTVNSGSPLLRQLREGLLQMLGCDMNKEKNFPNFFPFLFLAENTWSPEFSYHDNIGINQAKNSGILHVLENTISAYLKLGH